MNSRLLMILIWLHPLFSAAQSNFKEGKVVTVKGDTINGLIDYKEWYRNPDKILFKNKQEEVNPQTFTVDNATWFTVTGLETYARFTVRISLNEIKLDRLKEQNDTSTVTKTVFLKEMLKGDKANLYSYKDEIKERFYIWNKQQREPEELIYRKTLKEMEEVTQALYKQQLMNVAIQNGAVTAELDRFIQSSHYSKDDLIKIVGKINRVNETAFTEGRSMRGNSTFFVNIGVHNSRMSYKGESIVTIDKIDEMGRDKYRDRVTKTYLPIISTGMDFYVNPAVKRLFIRTEIAAASMKSTATSYYKFNNYNSYETENTYKFSSLNISLIPQVIYNFYNTDNFKFYLGAGASFTFLHNTDNTLQKRELNQTSNNVAVEDNHFALKKYYLTEVVRTGVRINKRFDLSAIWSNPVEYTNYTFGTTASIKAGLLAFCVGYSFGR